MSQYLSLTDSQPSNIAALLDKLAFNLLVALATESLERRFDNAFGVTRTEQERDERLSQRIQQLERDLREAMNFEAVAQYERDYMESVLRQHGIDPWALPNTEDDQE